MTDTASGPSKGYQKRVSKSGSKPQTARAQKSTAIDYTSPAAKKWPLFLKALESGNTDAVTQFIAEGINVNVLRSGVTPLMIAAQKGHVETAEALLQAGANINERSDEGETALHKAAAGQAGAGIVELLVRSGIDLEAKSMSGKTALQLAEGSGHRDVVVAIKKHQGRARADAREWDDFLNSPEGKPYKRRNQYDSLTAVLRFWWIPILPLGGIGFLMGMLFNAAVLGGIIGVLLASAGDAGMYIWKRKTGAYLDELGPLPDIDLQTLREKRKAGESLAIEKRIDLQIVEETTGDESVNDAPIEPVETEEYLMERIKEDAAAARRRRIRVLAAYSAAVLAVFMVIGALIFYQDSLARWYFTKKLERSGIPFSEKAFLEVVATNNTEATDLFIKAGINLDAQNDQGQTALLIASGKGHIALLTKLAGMNTVALRHTDKSGYTALMTAARQGKESSVKALCESGADINFTTTSPEGAATALQAALAVPDFKEEHLKIVQYLLQRGADPKARNTAGRFPLLFAVEQNRSEAAKLLIERGAGVNETDKKGEFPLLTAACRGHAGIVALLLEHGAQTAMASADGKTPLMCAAEGGHGDMVKALLGRGALINAKTTAGSTALAGAARMGHIALAEALLKHGADPAGVKLSDAFLDLPGKAIAIDANRKRMVDLLGSIAKAASGDGYVVIAQPTKARPAGFRAKGAWNKMLPEFARKNHFLPVLKEKEIYLLPYDPAAVKREPR